MKKIDFNEKRNRDICQKRAFSIVTTINARYVQNTKDFT